MPRSHDHNAELTYAWLYPLQASFGRDEYPDCSRVFTSGPTDPSSPRMLARKVCNCVLWRRGLRQAPNLIAAGISAAAQRWVVRVRVHCWETYCGSAIAFLSWHARLLDSAPVRVCSPLALMFLVSLHSQASCCQEASLVPVRRRREVTC